jgi:hypothetical protein
MGQVFVSYSHQNRSPVSRIARALSESGYEVWWDSKLRSHQDFGKEIEAALGDAKCAVVAWSSHARDSLWVRAEATEALNARKLVQVSLDGSRPPLPFTMIHLLNLSQWSGEPADPPWEELRDAVDAVIWGVPSRLPAAVPPRLGGLLSSALLGVGALVLALLAAGLTGAAAAGAFSSTMFDILAIGLLCVSVPAFLYMLFRFIKIMRASR